MYVVKVTHLILLLLFLNSCNFNNLIYSNISSDGDGTQEPSLPSFSYHSNYKAYQNNSLTTITPSIGGGTLGAQFSISPDLPPGMVLDSDTGEIGGTPTAVLASTDYTVTLTLEELTETTQFSLEVGKKVVVNSSAEGSDASVGDGVCDEGSGVCTLRAAIEEANHEYGQPWTRIELAASVYAIESNQLTIDKPVELVGQGIDVTTLDASSSPADTRLIKVLTSLEFSVPIILEDLTLTGGKASDGEGGGAIFVGGFRSLILNRVKIINNNANASSDHCGGGLLFKGSDLTISDSLIDSNSCSAASGSFLGGGGIQINGTSGLTAKIYNTKISNNSSYWYGGGLYMRSGTIDFKRTIFYNNTVERQGGGLYLFGTRGLIEDSIVEQNSSTNDHGGGLFVTSTSILPMIIANTTITGNTATSVGFAANGGGLYSDRYDPFGDAPLILKHVTIAQNTAKTAGHEVYVNSARYLSIQNSIVTNSSNTCAGSGTFISLGYNIEETDTCQFSEGTDLPSTDPQLGGLLDNGGQASYGGQIIQSFLPDQLSSAVDAIPESSCDLISDQRGLTRPVDKKSTGLRCDIGASELQ